MRLNLPSATIRRFFTDREALDKEGLDFIYVKYRIVPAKGLSLDEAAARILMITTLRTMERLYYEPSDLYLPPRAGAVVAAEETGHIEVAYPIDICSSNEGLSQLLQVVTTSAEYAYTDDIWVEGVELPRCFISRFKGPRFGVQGIRELFREQVRPLLGLILKPRRGVSLNTILEVGREALEGGVDFLVDDLLIVDPDGDLSFKSRVPRIASLVGRFNARPKTHKAYFCNCTFSPRRTLENALWAKDQGVAGVEVNGVTLGFGGLHELVDDLNGALPVISTNMGSGMFSRATPFIPQGKKPTGMSEAVITKMSRLAGADAVHAGTSASECYGQEAWAPAIQSLVVDNGLRPSFAVAEGDLTVANVWENIKSLGTDALIEPTAGIINFPGGIGKGAEAFRTLLDHLRPSMTDQEAHLKIGALSRSSKGLERGLLEGGYNPKL